LGVKGQAWELGLVGWTDSMEGGDAVEKRRKKISKFIL
jgi:hypothetical protein